MAADRKTLEGYIFYGFFLLAFVTVFFTQKMHLGFDNYPHGYLSSHGMALSENILSNDSIFMYNSVAVKEGAISYDGYNRFPPLSFLLIKSFANIADTYSMRIYMARQLMHVFFMLSFVFTFLIIKLFLNERIIALTSALLVFSSFYFLHYANMIFVDIPSLCFFCAALYMALAVGRGKSINVLVLSVLVFLSAATAWQSGAVYFLWFLIQICRKILKRNNYLKISCFCFVGFVCVSLSFFIFQLYLEHLATGSAFSDLPTVKSVMFRLGIAKSAVYESYADRLSYFYFIKHEAFRIVRLMIPFYVEIYWSALSLFLKGLHLVYLLCIFCLFLFFIKTKSKVVRPDEMLLLLLSGLFWTAPMKMHVAFHDFQTIFYIGIPICFYVFCCSSIAGRRLLFLSLALLLFVSNVFFASLNKAAHQEDTAVISEEFDIIKPILPLGAKVYVKDKDVFAKIGEDTGSSPLHALDYYLAGCVYAAEDHAEYIIALGRNYNDRIQTDNKNINLFLK